VKGSVVWYIHELLELIIEFTHLLCAFLFDGVSHDFEIMVSRTLHVFLGMGFT
jgi:hypothetical protein